MANGGRLEEGDFCQTQALCQEEDYGMGCSVRHAFFHHLIVCSGNMY